MPVPVHGRKARQKKLAAKATPVKEAASPVAINKDEENAYHLRVDDLVASPARFSRSARAVDDVAAEYAEASKSEQATADASPDAGDDGPKADDGQTHLYTDPETQRLVVGHEGVTKRIWGWRRLSKLSPGGSLFESGNRVLRTKYKYPAPKYPTAADDPAVAEAVGALARDNEKKADEPAADGKPKPAAVPRLYGIMESLPRFPHRQDTIALDDRGVNLALLAVSLAGTVAPLANLFHSLRYRDRGLYSMQFFTSHTRAEAVRDAAQRAGMPLTDLSPVRERGSVHDSEMRGPFTPAEPEPEPLSPKRQIAELLGVEDPDAGEHRPSLALLSELFRKQSTQVTVDDLVPIGKDGKPLFGLTDQTGERWKVVVEKAFAKHFGSYAALENPNPVTVLRTLTGGRVTAESWGGTTECLNMFPDLEGATRFVWWRIAAAKKVGQLCWFTHRTELPQPGETADVANDDASPDVGVLQEDVEEAERLAADDAEVAPVTPPVPAAADGQPEPNDGEPTARAPSQLQELRPSFADAPLTMDGAGGGVRESVAVPPSWGSEDWATTQGDSADVTDAALALHTAALSLRDANVAGVRWTSTGAQPPSTEGWNLIKVVQQAGDIGAERFSYAHFSGQWSKELREHFDFKNSDSEVCYATPEDIAEAFDTVTLCSNYVGAPPSFSFTLRPQATASDAAKNSTQVLVVLRPGVQQFSVTDAACFDLQQCKSVQATSSLQMRLFPIDGSKAEAFLAPRRDLGAAEVLTTALDVAPVLAVNMALGVSYPLPDHFQTRKVVQHHASCFPVDETPGAAEADSETAESASSKSELGLAFVLSVGQEYHTHALAVTFGLRHTEVAFATVLE